MSKIKLDLSQFKHVRSNAKTTTLRHAQGHELTIAHDSLSPEAQAQLNQLAKISETPTQADELMHKGAMAEGGEIGPNNPKLAESKKVPSQTSYAMPPTTPMAQGVNAGAQRKKVFGTQAAPTKPEMRSKHMEHISRYAEKNFGMSINPSGGKINPKTGQRRDENPELGVDKPDWRSGQLESQSNPDAMVHELAHLLLLPKGVGLREGQKLMGKQYADVQKKFGYMKQKRSQGEIQPMAMEQILRRHMGLPANQNSVPVKEGEGPRTSVDTGELAGTRINKGNKTVDLIRQSRFLSPENKQRLEEFTSGKIKFHPEYGWTENPEALGAMSRMYKEEHPNAVKKMADGGLSTDPNDYTGNIESQARDSIKQYTDQQHKIDYGYADGGEVNDQSPTSDPSTWFINQTPEAKPSPQESKSMGQVMDTNPITAATRITPGEVEQAGNAVMGSVGAPEAGIEKVAATAENLIPEIRATAQDLTHSIEQYGYNHYRTQSLAQKLKGHLDSLANNQQINMPMKDNGGRLGYDEGGKATKSDLPPESISDTNEDLTPTTVPTQMTPEPQPTDDQIAYKQGHDAFLKPAPGIGGVVQMIRQGISPEEREKNASEAGLNNVAVMHEDKEAANLQKQQENVRTAKINSQRQSIGLPPLPGTTQPNAVDSTPTRPDTMPQVSGVGQPPQSTPTDNLTDYEGMVGQGLRNQISGINQAVGVAGQRGLLEQQALEADMQNKQAANSAFLSSMNELNQERQNHISDIQKGYIDPQQYWKGTYNPETKQMEGGHSKLLAAIGMIIGGWDPAGRGNGVVDLIQNQINRNIEAQKANLSAKQNLLMANLHQFQNLRDATDMTRLMQHDMVTNELQQTAARTVSPAAKAAALSAIGQLQLQTAPLMQQFAMRRAFMKLANSGEGANGATEQMLNYMEASGMPQAKEMRERYVPGLGIAATPVPQPVKDKIMAYQNTNRLMRQAMEFAQQHAYNLSALSPSERAAGKSLMNELVTNIRVAEDQGVYKPSDAKFLNETLGENPANFFNAVRTQPRLLEIEKLKMAEYHNLLQNLGGNLLHNAQSVPAAVHSAQAVIHDANGKAFTRQIINGKAYMIPVGVSK